MKGIDKAILKELDKKRLNGYEVGVVMKLLTTKDLKEKILNYLIENRIAILSLATILNTIKAYQ